MFYFTCPKSEVTSLDVWYSHSQQKWKIIYTLQQILLRGSYPHIKTNPSLTKVNCANKSAISDI